MKKVVIIIGFVFGIILLSSCTDNTTKGIETEKKIEIEIENSKSYVSDKDEEPDRG